MIAFLLLVTYVATGRQAWIELGRAPSRDRNHGAQKLPSLLQTSERRLLLLIGEIHHYTVCRLASERTSRLAWGQIGMLIRRGREPANNKQFVLIVCVHAIHGSAAPPPNGSFERPAIMSYWTVGRSVARARTANY